MSRPGRRRSDTRRRCFASFTLSVVLAGCGTPTSPSSPGASVPAASPGSSTAAATAPASAAPSTETPPTPTPAPTGTVSAGFGYGDILKVQVTNLAVRAQPKRSAALVHAYDLTGPAPIDHGLVRLDKGAFVSVHLGPIRVGETAWYLVWPSKDGNFHTSPINWYTQHPSEGSPGPGWMATSVGADVYATLVREPGNAELESYEPIGMNLAGTGPLASALQPRHDGWSLTWAIATTASGTPCNALVELVPEDGDFEPVAVLETTTSGVKVSSRNGVFVTAPWLPAAAGSWETFAVEASGTCRWAIRLMPLHHD